jgi:cytochrome b561
MVRKARANYSVLHIVLHWLVVLLIVGTFCLGLWMVELDYYDAWYKKGPDLHRSIGVMILCLMCARLVSRFVSGVPAALLTHAPWERRLASIMHIGLYLLVLATGIAGYLISTADGRGVLVFDWFEIPATITGIARQEDVAGDVHLVLAVTLIVMAAIHGGAALKHHFVDRDPTLRRMLGKAP